MKKSSKHNKCKISTPDAKYAIERLKDKETLLLPQDARSVMMTFLTNSELKLKCEVKQNGKILDPKLIQNIRRSLGK